MIKALLIDNDSDTWQELVETCRSAGFGVETIHCTQVMADSAVGYDVAILSGGWWYDDEIQHLETYSGEMELITRSSVPVLGICLGMQLMQIAHTGEVQMLDKPQHDRQTIRIEPGGQKLLGWPETVTVHKNHTMGAVTIAPGFEVLGRSEGHIEIIRHTSRPLLGVQFHPEVGDLTARTAMITQLVDSVMTLRVADDMDAAILPDTRLVPAAVPDQQSSESPSV